MVKFNVENKIQTIDDKFLPNFPTSGTVATDMNLDSFLILKRFIETSVFDPFYYSIFEDKGRTYQLYFDSLVEEERIRNSLYAEGNEDEDLLDENHNLIFLDENKFDSLLKSQEERLKNPNFIFPDAKLKPRPWSEVEKYLKFFDTILTPNTIVAGGSVFLSLFEGYIGDIDIFIYGLNENDAKRKIIEIYEILNKKYELSITRSNGAVTFLCKDRKRRMPHIKIQVILRLYKKKYEIIHGFDVDSCCIGYDGKSIMMTPRCNYSLIHGFNTVNFERLSPSYTYRLIKYANRGMKVLDYGFNREHFLENNGPETIKKREKMLKDKYMDLSSFYKLVKGLDLLLVAEHIFKKYPEPKLDYEVNVSLVGGKQRQPGEHKRAKDYTTLNFIMNGNSISDYENMGKDDFAVEEFEAKDEYSYFWYNDSEYQIYRRRISLSYPKQVYNVNYFKDHEFRSIFKPKIEFKDTVIEITRNGKVEVKYFFDREILDIDLRDVDSIEMSNINDYQEISRNSAFFPATTRIYNVTYKTEGEMDFSPFVIFEIPKAQYESILRVSEKIREDFHQTEKPELHLNRKLEFKKINPGEQATSTFNVLVLKDPKEWYNGDFYTL